MCCNGITDHRALLPGHYPGLDVLLQGKDGDRLFADRKCWGVDNWRQLPRKTRAV